MKKIIYKNVVIFLLFLSFIIVFTGNSKAVLQSNGNTPAQYNLDAWMTNVRKMEALGGAMGLEETLNSNLTASSETNNIDVHMQKNTEYGALAILSASSYGNPNVIADGQTTTGNVTGVVMKLNKEWVAAGNVSTSKVYPKAVSRYKNYYNVSYVAKKGDAISETKGWHGSKIFNWISNERTAGLVRAWPDSIFSYQGRGQYDAYTTEESAYIRSYSSRAVVVVGEGL